MHSDDGHNSVIDIISVHPVTGVVQLAVADERGWEDVEGHLRWLVEKLNLYIGFVVSGQINEDPAYAGRPVKFYVHFAIPPPSQAYVPLIRMRDHLRVRQIDFAVTEAGNIRDEVDLNRWSVG